MAQTTTSEATHRAVTMAPVVVAVFLVFVAAKLAQDFLVPVVVGILMSYTLRPLVSALERLRIHRALGAALVMTTLAASLGTAAYALRDDAANAIAGLPDVARRLRVAAHEANRGPAGPATHVRAAAAELDKAAAEASGKPVTAQPSAPQYITQIQEFVATQSAKALAVFAEISIAALLAFLLLVSGDKFRRKVVHLTGNSLAERRVTVEILDEIDTQVQRYMLVLLVTNVAIGLVSWGILAGFGIAHAAVWGALAGVLHIVPYAGTMLTAGIVGAAAFAQSGSPGDAAFVAAAVGGAAAVIGLGLSTWLSGRASSMNAVAVFLGVLFFGWLWGGWGLLLGAPLLAIVKTIAVRIESMHAVAELLG